MARALIRCGSADTAFVTDSSAASRCNASAARRPVNATRIGGDVKRHIGTRAGGVLPRQDSRRCRNGKPSGRRCDRRGGFRNVHRNGIGAIVLRLSRVCLPLGTAAVEKRNLALEIPAWETDLCTQCGKCPMVCPHAAIREDISGNVVKLEELTAKFRPDFMFIGADKMLHSI